MPPPPLHPGPGNSHTPPRAPLRSAHCSRTPLSNCPSSHSRLLSVTFIRHDYTRAFSFSFLCLALLPFSHPVINSSGRCKLKPQEDAARHLLELLKEMKTLKPPRAATDVAGAVTRPCPNSPFGRVWRFLKKLGHTSPTAQRPFLGTDLREVKLGAPAPRMCTACAGGQEPHS